MQYKCGCQAALFTFTVYSALLLLLLLLLCRAGLDVLLSDLSVVGCHSTRWAAKYHSELGAAAAMFKAGYSIDSLLIR
jgi:hypothetical protein